MEGAEGDGDGEGNRGSSEVKQGIIKKTTYVWLRKERQIRDDESCLVLNVKKRMECDAYMSAIVKFAWSGR